MNTERYFWKIKNSNNKGFSIIEIVIVCLVIMVLLVPVFTLMSQGNAGTSHNRNEILARQYAANIIAYYNLIPYNKIKELNKEELASLVLESKDKKIKIDFNDLGKDFERFKSLNSNFSVKVKEFKNEFHSYKIVSVSVDWQEPGKSAASKVSMSGMVTKR